MPRQCLLKSHNFLLCFIRFLCFPHHSFQVFATVPGSISSAKLPPDCFPCITKWRHATPLHCDHHNLQHNHHHHQHQFYHHHMQIQQIARLLSFKEMPCISKWRHAIIIIIITIIIAITIIIIYKDNIAFFACKWRLATPLKWPLIIQIQCKYAIDIRDATMLDVLPVQFWTFHNMIRKSLQLIV